MKINTVDTVIQDFREGQNIFRRPSVELMVREISRQAKRIEELKIHNKDFHLVCINALDLHRESDVPKIKDIPKIIEELRTRVQELEQERRWIHQENTMIVKKDGDLWGMMLPDFIDLQNSKSHWFTNNPVNVRMSEFIDAVYWLISDHDPLPQPPKEEE